MISNIYKKLGDSGELEVSDFIAYGGDHERRKIEEPVGTENLKRFFYTIVLVVAAITARTAYLQITKGSYYASKAENNRINNVIVKAPRGMIVDRRGKPLVENVASFDLVVIPARLPEGEQERNTILRHCSELVSKERPETEKILQPGVFDLNSFKPYLIKENLTHAEAVSIEVHKNECPGFEMEKTAVRQYPDPLVFAHLMGYTGKVREDDLKSNQDYLMTDNVGRAGVEEIYEKDLKGIHGSVQVEVDSGGHVLRELQKTPPQSGRRLVLGVDKDLQAKLYESLVRSLATHESRKGSAIAIDPRDGSILALVNVPGFDNNLFSGGIKKDDYQKLNEDPDKPLLNRAISGTYPPGSTIKPLIAAAALEEGVVGSDTAVNCPGALSVGGWRFGDWKTHGAGIDLNHAIAESCNVYFYTVGGGYGDIGGLGMDRMKKYEELFGFNSLTGIDLAGEKKGFVPSEQWKAEARGESWYIGDTYHAAIGQGDISTTPMQIAAYIGAIANGGTLYRPHVAAKLTDEMNGDTVRTIGASVNRTNFVSRDNIEAVRRAMRETVIDGSARSLNDLGVDACGKTGTAQVGGTDKTHAWFAGFAPFDNPEIAIVVLVEEGGEGSAAAVPVAKDALEYYFKNK